MRNCIATPAFTQCLLQILDYCCQQVPLKYDFGMSLGFLFVVQGPAADTTDAPQP
jgi:hypothetical protein